MAGNLTENFNELCRLCASKINLLVAINIFQSEGSAREITKKISACLPIQVHETDRLPKMICTDCAYKLDICFLFYEKCVDTENLFFELIKNNNISNQEDMKDNKNMNLIPTVEDQQIQIVQNTQELLNHSTIALTHELPNRENIMVDQQMILNSHDNITIHNHELDNIEITPHELNSHGIPHNIHSQQLDLQHESTIAQLVQPDLQISESHLTVQNLELIHTQHNNLIANHYETIHDKSNTNDDDNCAGNNITTVTGQRESVKMEEVKPEKHELIMVKTIYSDASDTDSSDSDFDPNLDHSNGEIVKCADPIDLLHYEEPEQYILGTTESEVDLCENTESTQYYCNVCGKNILGKEQYLNHYGEHINKCLLCHEDFTDLDQLKLHREQRHAQNSDKSEQSTSNSSQDRMEKSPLDDNFFKEESSDDEINGIRENASEFMNENDDEDEADDIEGNNKNTKRKRWEPKVCKECGKSYKTNYKLAEHMRKHTGEQPFKCTMCEKAFRSKIGLAQHEAKHTGQYDYSCPTCGKGFQCKSYLIVHQRVHSNLKPFPCSECGRNFKTKQSLLDHMNRHLGVKPFMCDICGRGFITKGLCKSHQKVHSGRDNRQFPCTVCNKLFVSKSYLATHLRIHTGEKPFMCEVCGKGFLTRVDLRIHSTMHTGEKSFVCEICGKAFARRDALRCHRRSHTGERPYRCDICGQTFTQFSPMAIHKRLHTGERPYACEVCNKTFVSRSTMMSHRKKHVP